MEDYMTIMIAHDNDVSNLYVGKTIKQGDVFYQEGTAGNATGNHVQLSVARGKFTDTGWHENEYGNWEINNEIDPTKALWLRRDTVVINNGGYTWKTTDTNTYEESTTYTVKPGDTLTGIAIRYGINWHDLYNANINTIGSAPNNIYVGQILTIPIGYTYYVVASGDTLSAIARRFNTTWEKIYEDNKNIIGNDPNNLKIGQKLKINL
jgi:LysM repeat protein